MWALHAGFLALEVSPTVPTPVLAEAWRGGTRQASLARFLALCTTEPLTDEQAKAVGTLAARAGHDDIVDVTVVEGAIRRHDAVVTSNPTHIHKVADATRTRLTIESV
ncbi:MAG: twitching motility protein PilT [Actinobacteria bacterium]|nr:twitching motility protein PilT [Actinomycetota bacterium]